MNLRLRRLDRIFVRADKGLRGFGSFLGHEHVVFRDDAGRGRRGFQPIVGALRGCQFRFCLRPLQTERLRLGLRFGNLRLHFRRFEGHEHLTLLDRASSIDRHALHKSGEPGVDRDGQVGLKLSGQLDLPLDGLGGHADHLHRRRSRRRRLRGYRRRAQH